MAKAPRHVIVIGAQRCGTTFLAEALNAHPQITMAQPSPPEPKVFLTDPPPNAEDYRQRWFAHARDAELFGEKSTSYLEHPASIARIQATLRDVAIVAQFRDPIDRAISNWAFSTDNGLEDLPLTVALRADLAGDREWDPATISVSPFAYVRRGRFVDYLQSWWAAFPGRVHVTFLPEVAREHGVEQLFVELGVDPAPARELSTQPVNGSQEIANALDDDLIDELRDYYVDSDARLARLLDRDLPWPTRGR